MTDSQTTLLQQLNSCLHCRVPSCKASCPLGNDVPTVLQLVSQQQFAAAVEVVGHPFGGVCGSVCPHEQQCQGGCVLSRKNNALPIGQAEALAFSLSPYKVCRKDDKLANKKICVVGGGVSGVTFAVKCYQLGADVTIIESNRLLNTLYSIPEFRLSHKLLDDIVYQVQNSQISLQIGCKVDFELLQNLSQNYDFVYLATGVVKPHTLGIDGERFATTADDFLRQGNQSSNVIVVGGGNTAMDCARKNARLGGQTRIAYRRTVQDMPTFDKEKQAAVCDGVEFCQNLAPVKVEQTADGQLAVTFAQTQSEGRGKLVVTDQTETLVCDKLVVATGNGFDSSVYPADRFVVVDQRGNVQENIYAGGDAIGHQLVVSAVKDAIVAFEAICNKF